MLAMVESSAPAVLFVPQKSRVGRGSSKGSDEDRDHDNVGGGAGDVLMSSRTYAAAWPSGAALAADVKGRKFHGGVEDSGTS